MDIATIIGFSLCGVAIIGSILLSSPLLTFYDLPSVFCVVVGAIGTVFIKWPIEQIFRLSKSITKIFFMNSFDSQDTIKEIGVLAETARRESVFALEKVAVEDKFIKKAMGLAADNRPPEVIAAILQLEIESMEERHKEAINILDALGADAPAFGMLGTLIGLVIMLQNMSDPSSIGPAMAIALLTTFYGSIIANVFAIPMKNKLEVRNKEEVVRMNIVVAGTLGIVAGENPRLIKEKLNSFLPPAQRLSDDDAGAEKK